MGSYRSVFITNGDQEINRLTANHFLHKGDRVTLQFYDERVAGIYEASLDEETKQRFTAVTSQMADPDSIPFLLDRSVEIMGGLNVFVHGNEWMDEEAALEHGRLDLGEYINERFTSIFLWNRAAGAYMARKKEGHVVFPLVCDTLYYAGYPSSPVMNHGKISMMKCLAKEWSPFRISVNAVTFGYYSPSHDFNDNQEKKRLQKLLEIFALKPALNRLEEMIPSLDMVTGSSGSLISGQNIHVGAGVDTTL